MKDSKAILEIARKTIASEGDAIHHLQELLTDDFARAVTRILESEGRVVVSGIGKSAIIASKIVATLNSTGTPAIFMHAADAIHGDLGTIQKNDVVIYHLVQNKLAKELFERLKSKARLQDAVLNLITGGV